MVLVYINLHELGDFVRANVRKYSSTMEHMGCIFGKHRARFDDVSCPPRSRPWEALLSGPFTGAEHAGRGSSHSGYPVHKSWTGHFQQKKHHESRTHEKKNSFPENSWWRWSHSVPFWEIPHFEVSVASSGIAPDSTGWSGQSSSTGAGWSPASGETWETFGGDVSVFSSTKFTTWIGRITVNHGIFRPNVPFVLGTNHDDQCDFLAVFKHQPACVNTSTIRKFIRKRHDSIMTIYMTMTFNSWWFLVGGLVAINFEFSHILGMSSSQLTFIFFRRVAQLPTRFMFSCFNDDDWHVFNILSTVTQPAITTQPGKALETPCVRYERAQTPRLMQVELLSMVTRCGSWSKGICYLSLDGGQVEIKLYGSKMK